MSRLLQTLLGVTFMLAIIAMAAPAIGQADDAPDRPRPHAGDRDQPGRDDDGARRPGRFGPMALRGLGLTDEQRQQVRDIFDEARQSNEQYRDEHADEIEALRKQIDDARLAIEEAHQKQRELRAGAPGSPEKIKEKLLNVLTDEQKQKLEHRRDRMKHRFDRRRSGRWMDSPMRQHKWDGPRRWRDNDRPKPEDAEKPDA